jgi:hypothetical protein
MREKTFGAENEKVFSPEFATFSELRFHICIAFIAVFINRKQLF